MPRSTSSSTSRPTMSSARLRSLAPSRSIVATFLPRRSTEIRSATSSTSCSLCVIRMIDVPARDERAQHGEELVDLLRRQHRGRLVEDQDARVAVERLEDLDALLLADADLLDDRVGIDGQAVLAPTARARARAPCRGRAARARVGSAPSTMFSTTRHHRDQHEVLVHHADPEADRVARSSRSRRAARATKISPSSGR